jgi:chromate reductase
MVSAGVRILAISGSLRAESSNTAILHLAAHVAPEGTRVEIFDGLDRLPYFNPDLDRSLNDPSLSVSVRAMRAQIGAADALLISSPEYAHGVPGVLKNALDWLVGGEEMVEKPVALLDTSAPSYHAQASLAETLRTMSARLVDEAGLSVSLRGRGKDLSSLADDAALVAALRGSLRALADAARTSGDDR